MKKLWEQLKTLFSKRSTWIVLVWGVLPLCLAALWCWDNLFPYRGNTGGQATSLWIYNSWIFGAGLYWYILWGTVGTSVVLLVAAYRHRESAIYEYQRTDWDGSRAKLDAFEATLPGAIKSKLMLICVTLTIVASLGVGYNLWNHDKIEATYYANSTTFYTPDLTQAPDALLRLTQGAKAGDGTNCDLVGPADVRACLKKGTLSDAGWDPRTGSLEGARIALKAGSSVAAGSSLNGDTVTYLNAQGDQTAGWSGVIDGTGRSQALAGVAEWSGSTQVSPWSASGEVNECKFEGNYAINRALSGEWSNSLSNLLAENYPSQTWQMSDVWGYCKKVSEDAKAPREPVVVIPTTMPITWNGRTVDTAGGVIVVEGDHGQVKLTYHSDVSAGEFPGPVYPESLVATQRTMLNWAAGRAYLQQDAFGFETTTAEPQKGNDSEYLLRDAETGRLQFVTPLTLRKSQSQDFAAYGITSADEVHAGELNQYQLYALANNGDPRKTYIAQLDKVARQYISDYYGTFLNTGGTLLEYTPVKGDVWRAYGERNGQVVLYIDVTAHNTAAPVVVPLGTGASDVVPPATGSPGVATSTPPSGPSTSDNSCGADPSTLSEAQLATCLQAFSNAIAAKAGQH